MHASSNSKKALMEKGSVRVLKSCCGQWGQRAGHCKRLILLNAAYSSGGEEAAPGLHDSPLSTEGDRVTPCLIFGQLNLHEMNFMQSIRRPMKITWLIRRKKKGFK